VASVSSTKPFCIPGHSRTEIGNRRIEIKTTARTIPLSDCTGTDVSRENNITNLAGKLKLHYFQSGRTSLFSKY
jgi:hypothetical protein